jgi:hypothetical protein
LTVVRRVRKVEPADAGLDSDRRIIRFLYEVAETVQTQPGARTMAIDLKTHRIYLPAARFEPAPPATPENPRPRPAMIKGSFVVLVVGQ